MASVLSVSFTVCFEMLAGAKRLALPMRIVRWLGTVNFCTVFPLKIYVLRFIFI